MGQSQCAECAESLFCTADDYFALVQISSAASVAVLWKTELKLINYLFVFTKSRKPFAALRRTILE